MAEILFEVFFRAVVAAVGAIVGEWLGRLLVGRTAVLLDRVTA